MAKPVVFSLIESPQHPKLSPILEQLGFAEVQFSSVRKILNAIKKQQPDIILADFIYAYATNYDSNHMCNMDSLFVTLQKKAMKKPDFIFFTSKSELDGLQKTMQHYEGSYRKVDVFPYPVNPGLVKDLLLNFNNTPSV